MDGKLYVAPILGYDDNGKPIIGEKQEFKGVAQIPKLEINFADDKPRPSYIPPNNEMSGEITAEFTFYDSFVWTAVFKGVPSWRVYHLALHGRKERTRKKNRNRCKKYWKSLDK